MSAAPAPIVLQDSSLCTEGDSASTIDGEHAGRSGDIKSAPSLIDGVLSVQVRFYGRLSVQWVPIEHLRITRNVTYDTGPDRWRHRQRTPEGNRRFLGPCPMCGSRTFDYGGGWACTDYRCSKSPEYLVCNNGPEPSWWNTEIRVHRDGDAWFASGPGFQNIQESLCGFGGTPDQSVAAYQAAVRISDPVAPTAAPAGPAPVVLPASTVTVTLSTADALLAGKQMRTMAHANRCGCLEGNELFARVGGQLFAAAMAGAASASETVEATDHDTVAPAPPRIVITGGPRTGKTTLARSLGLPVLSTDDLIKEYEHLGREAWSAVSQHVVDHWFTRPGPWVIEGVAMSRALRKWRDQHPDAPLPVDRVIYLTTAHTARSPGQIHMEKGVVTVHREIEAWLAEHGVATERMSTTAQPGEARAPSTHDIEVR